MADRINRREIELLSAYLDGEVNESERQQLDSRLARDAGLRRALADLRKTRSLLRMAPPVQRPRSFTLTPQMVRSKARLAGVFSTVRVVSIVAGVLFALVFAGDLFFKSLSSGTIAFSPQSFDMAEGDDMAAAPITGAAAELDARDDAEAVEMYEAPEEQTLPEAPAGEDASDDTADGDVAAEGETGAEVGAQAPPGEEASGLTSTGTPEVSATSELSDAPPPPIPTQSPPAEMEKSTANGENGLQVTAQSQAATQQSGQGGEGFRSLATDEAAGVEPGFKASPVRIIQTGLAVLAVFGGLAAALLRKRMR